MKLLVLLLLSLWWVTPAAAQNADDAAYAELLQTYHTSPDPELVSKTVAFANSTAMPLPQLTPLLQGFFGALFQQDPATRKALLSRIDDIRSPEFQQLLQSLRNTNIDSLYARAAPSPALNDMNWASYFATGNTRYLDNLLGYTQYYNERRNLTLFLTAGSAMWSLASNAGQYPVVHAYLAASKNPNAALALQQSPAYFKEQMPIIIRKYNKRGGWDKSTYPQQ